MSRLLSIAVASGRVGYVVLEGPSLKAYRISTASKTPTKAHETARAWIGEFAPDVIVTEAILSNRRKRGKTVAIMEAVEQASRESDVISVVLSKVRTHRDKYAEAQTLARQFPELRSRLAMKPKIWLAEPRRMILFEALSLALSLRDKT